MGYFAIGNSLLDSAAPSILWRWNGVDITQFGNGAGVPNDQPGPGNSTGTLSTSFIQMTPLPNTLDASSTTPVLMYTTLAGAPGGVQANFLINDLPALPDRYTIRARIGPRGTAQYYNNIRASIIPAHQNNAHYWYVGRPAASTTLDLFVANGNDGVSNGWQHTGVISSFSNNDSGWFLQIHVDLRDPAGVGTLPGASFRLDTINDGSVYYANTTTGGTTIAGGTSIVTGGWNGWNLSTTLKQVGMAFYEVGGAGASWISDFRIETLNL
jgi:hypothetical protein